jgi:hypothetical protein
MQTHLRDYQHGDYTIATYQNRDKNTGSIAVYITLSGERIGAFGDLDTEPQALQIGKAFCGGYSEGVARQRAPFEVKRPDRGAGQRPGQNHHMTRLNDVLREAAGLISEDGENTEYDRALVELCGRLIGLDLSNDDTRDTILAMLRAIA